ncbi:hypothetical protein CHS0354_035376, partial [Potamilus streckersoni]
SFIQADQIYNEDINLRLHLYLQFSSPLNSNDRRGISSRENFFDQTAHQKN